MAAVMVKKSYHNEVVECPKPPMDYSKVNGIASSLTDDECNALMVKLQRRKKLTSLKELVAKSAYLDYEDRAKIEIVLSELSGRAK